MSKLLNTSLIKEKLFEHGISQTKLSEELGVTRQAVSLWLKKQTFPRPSELLKLSKILKTKYSEIVNVDTSFEPQVAFRKVGSAKTRDVHFQRAKEMGYALEVLVDFLPQEMMIKLIELKNPTVNYDYIQKAVNLIRKKFELTNWEIEFNKIISILNSLNAILIPVLLGDKKNHENAIHIYLPKSQSTWIYINLDTKIFDFKFWLSHELGHMLTPTLINKQAEDFADNFAGALLYPEKLAKQKYYGLLKIKAESRIVTSIIKTAKELIISPITILKEVNKFAETKNLDKIDIDKNLFYGSNTNFNKSYKLISEILFNKQKPTIEEYIKISEENFETIFFKTLKKYHNKKTLRPNLLSSLINISYIDSKEIYDYLINTNAPN
jgi:transcriptional regulator with XRE-family HTH domain